MNREANPSPTSDADVEFIPVFTSSNFAEVEIITDIFEDEDIAYIVKKRQMSGFWTTIGEHDQIRVFVEAGGIDQARSLIQQALVDEAIPGDGNFIDDEQREKIAKAQQDEQ